MKRKDLINLALAVGLLGVSGVLIFRLVVAPQKTSEVPMIEIVPVIEGSYDQTAIDEINDRNQAVDFSVRINLPTGRNPNPFN